MKNWYINLLICVVLSIIFVHTACSSNDDEIDEEEPLATVYETKILDMSFDGTVMELPIVIDHDENTIQAYVTGSTDISGLVPNFNLSEKATISPPGGVAYNFSSAMTFQVVAPDKTYENYNITVDKVNNEILQFKLTTKQEAWAFAAREGQIEKVADNEYTISVHIHSEDDITNLGTVIEANEGTVITPDPAKVNNYSSPVEFVTSDGNGNNRKYTVTVTKHAEQNIIWNQENTFDNIEGIQMYTSNSSFRFNNDGTPMSFSAYAMKIDMNKGFKFVPYYNKQQGNMNVEQMAADYNSTHGVIPLIGINAGYFGSTSSYSLIIKDEELLASNVPQLSRSDSYYVTRGAFGHNDNSEFSADWVYTVNTNEVYGYPLPSPNIDGEDPQPKPSTSFPSGGEPYSMVNAIGGGPILLRDGQFIEDYQYELFYDDIIRSIANRTAIGITANNELIILVVDGRSTYSEGIAIRDMAKILKNDFECIHAMNLDGGGSSTLVINGELHNQYCIDNGQRNVLTGLLIVEDNN